MDPIKLKYGLDEIPPLTELYRVAVVCNHRSRVIIVGKIVAGLHFSSLSDQIVYIQKIFL